MTDDLPGRPQRLIAIGDIHGELDKLNRLLHVVQPSASDQLVFLGDYVDRGKNSKGVIDRLIEVHHQFPPTIFIRGNHEQMLLDALVELGVRDALRTRDLSEEYSDCPYESDLEMFLSNGGKETLRSYRLQDMADFHEEHIAFFEKTRLWWKYENFVFMHAGAEPDIPMDMQDPYVVLWKRNSPPGRNGEIHVVGHHPTQGEPYFEPGRYNLDTGAVYGQNLTACDVLTKQFWQVK